MKKFVLGALAAYGLIVGVGFGSIILGLLPVQADIVPSRLEARLLGAALRASVVRHAPKSNTPFASEESLIAGAKVYRQLCSRCHGVSKESTGIYGNSFYPPVPPLLGVRTPYTEGEMFWIVKHGIRNTAMPAWGNLLSDDDIWQVVAVIRGPNSLPESAATELVGNRHMHNLKGE
jgi:mono/diheme cytochrome c family protein